MNSPSPMRCLIIDDEELARTLLQNYADRLPQLQVVAQCRDPHEAVAHMQEQPIDLLLLDIQMPKITGLDFLKTLVVRPLVIFTTAYSQHALDGFALDVVDYLLKPFSFERFSQAIQKAAERHRLQQLDQQLEIPPQRDYLVVKSEHRLIRLRFADILYIEGMREYVAFHTAQGRIMSLYSLARLEAELPSQDFIRIHKSFIAGVRHVSALETDGLVVAQKLLPIGPNYREEVKSRLF